MSVEKQSNGIHMLHLGGCDMMIDHEIKMSLRSAITEKLCGAAILLFDDALLLVTLIMEETHTQHNTQ